LTDRASPFVLLRLFAAPALLVLWVCQVIRVSVMNSELPTQVLQSSLLELNLVYSENRGVNFGLFGDADANQLALAAIAGIVCTLLAVILLRRGRVAHAVAGGLIVGGGLSNIYERITQGFVFDYINTPFLGFSNPYSYNVADIFIVLPILWWVLIAD
jgi:signal peptidase II